VKYSFSSWHHWSTNKMHLSDEDGACIGPSAVYWLWRPFRWWVIAEDLGAAASSEANSCARHTRQHSHYVKPLPPVEWCSCLCSISWWSGGCNHWDTHLSGTIASSFMNTVVLKKVENATCNGNGQDNQNSFLFLMLEPKGWTLLIPESTTGYNPEAFPSTSDSLNPPQYDPS
jgi:hypothetical protein